MAAVGVVGKFLLNYFTNINKNYKINLNKGRAVLKYAPQAAQNLEKTLSSLPKTNISFSSLTDVKYYNGGFESKMTKREAALILGISPNANKIKIREAHKRIMSINHPDRAFGSPYIAAKLNEGTVFIKKRILLVTNLRIF